ncbi:hypothetical protein FKM82_017374 [Ascaphus truei]
MWDVGGAASCFPPRYGSSEAASGSGLLSSPRDSARSSSCTNLSIISSSSDTMIQAHMCAPLCESPLCPAL